MFARLLLDWTANAKQAAVLQTGARRVVLNCSRQWGKTTVAATKLVHLAVTRPGWCGMVVAENLGQTGEVFRKIDHYLDALGIPAKTEAGKRVARVLPNGSRIMGLAAREAGVRGYTADFVFIDGAARLEDDVFDSLLPVTAVRNGDLWMASTPMGRRGRFYELWAHGEGRDLLKISATWRENPRLAAGFVEQVRGERGEAYVAQEFECQFVESGQFLLSKDSVDGVLE